MKKMPSLFIWIEKKDMVCGRVDLEEEDEEEEEESKMMCIVYSGTCYAVLTG